MKRISTLWSYAGANARGLHLRFAMSSVAFASHSNEALEFIRDYFAGYCDMAIEDGGMGVGVVPRVVLKVDNVLYEEIASAVAASQGHECGGSLSLYRLEEGIDLLVDLDSTVLVNGKSPILIVDRIQKNCLIVVASDGDANHFFAMRVVRSLAQVEYMNRGMLPFHAASFVYRGRAVCLVGDKFAGKTTNLLQAILSKSCNFMSNDCTYIYINDDEVMACALPVSARIRQTTLDLLDGFACQLAKVAHNHIDNYMATAVKHREVESRVFASPTMLSRALSCSVQPVALVGAVVFPRYDSSCEWTTLERIDIRTGKQILSAMYLRDPVPHQPYWSRHVSFPDKAAYSNAAIHHIADSIPMYRLITGRRSLEAPPEWVMSTIS